MISLKYLPQLITFSALSAFLAFHENTILLWILKMIFPLLAFYSIDKMFNINFKPVHYSLVFLMIFFGISASQIYFRSTYYDKVLHLIFPLILSQILFFMFNKIKTQRKIKIALTFLSMIFAIFSLEIIEYFLDITGNLYLQGVFRGDMIILSRIDDTMIDMILGLIGAGTYTLIKIFSKTTSQS